MQLSAAADRTGIRYSDSRDSSRLEVVLRLLIPLCAFLAPLSLHAQRSDEPRTSDSGPFETHAEAPRATAVRIAGSMQVDGRLDEVSWDGAPPITRFTQIDPEEREPASQPTDVRLVYDDEALYIGAMLYDSGEILTRIARRDARLPDSDRFAVYIDSYHDHQTAYRFATNPSGQRLDEIISDPAGARARGVGSTGAGESGDTSWDPVWEVATDLTDDGWTVEMRIPFSQLRFSREAVQEWGIQLERTIRRREEQVLFAFIPKLERGGAARYGHLDGIRGIESGRRLEVLPYAGIRADYLRALENTDAAFENPFQSGSAYRSSAGLDLKYRLTSNLTLDATVNPDFGQVEVDPAVINLTAFETRFEERRPFFVEGADIFQFSEHENRGSTGRPPEFLYSRRIGRAPQTSIPSTAVYSDEPTATTILGAMKLTGRTRNGWSLGFLDAVTQRETAAWIDAEGIRSKAVLEPETNYLVGRLRRDMLGGRSRFGVMVSAMNRSLQDPLLRAHLHSSAYQAGVDFSHEWEDRTWYLAGAFASSLVRGSSDALATTQRSSAHYFQRPDADHLGADADLTSLSGYYAMLKLAKIAGAYRMRVDLAAESPGYEINDLGFQLRADRLIVDTDFIFQETVPGQVFRSWGLRGGPDIMWNYGGDLLHAQFVVVGSWQLLNYWGAESRIRFHPSVNDDRLTRGGPLAKAPAGYGGSFTVNSDTRRPYSIRASYNWMRDRGGSRNSTVNVNLGYRVRENWEVQLGPRYSRSYAVAQYVTTVDDPLAEATFGNRYIFGGLAQTTLAIDARLNVTLSPTLSFELYVQPLLSGGDYGGLKEFRAPRTFEFLRYGEDVGTLSDRGDGYFLADPDGDGPANEFAVANRDFNHLSLLGNAVLRWEWRAGSTLFLVWQQSRAQGINGWDLDQTAGRTGRLDISRDTNELLGIRPDNIFLVKVNYWLNP